MSQPTSLNHSSGSLTRWSQTIIPTAREAPADAESPSHIFLTRAGFIRKLGSGIYDYLPLGHRVITKISRIVRQEMDAAGAVECSMPVLIPIELYHSGPGGGTNRDKDYGDLLFKLNDRKGSTAALGPTHEEPIVDMMAGAIQSYKQLPMAVYQIQTKFRDEARPRSGLLRCREFLMKDAYSFHMNVEGSGGLNETYDRIYTAYSNVFKRCGLDFTVVEAESGPIGGSASHEFMVNAPSGEDTILKCPTSGYAANVEKCEVGDRGVFTLDAAPSGELTEVHTPNMPGIEQVGKFMGVKPPRMLKTIVFEVTQSKPDGTAKWALAVVRGDHDVNEGKVKTAVRALTGDDAATVTLADEKAAKAAGFAIGYVSPKKASDVPGTLLIIDHDVAQGGFWASGADKPDHHVKHFNWRREVGAILDDKARVKVGDVRNAMAGDPSPKAKDSKLETGRGIEVGHIFKLGTKYSDAMGFAIMDEKQVKRSVIMGCYGIGVSRTMAASVEQNNDANGIIWPMAIAPYHVLITIMKHDAPDHVALATRIATDLAAAGVDTLIDNRDERPGVKFKDADLIGIPIRLIIGEKAFAAGAVEFKTRTATDKGELVPQSDVVAWCVEKVNDAIG